jgi:predicted N-formylglutamate amidohydrolase
MTTLLMAPLLAADEPDPVLLLNPHGASPFLLTADHAGRALPRRLGTLGLPDDELERHIGWDIGIWGVAELLAEALDAPAIGQRYSRLAIDCNRHPGRIDSIPEISETTEIPGNLGVSDHERAQREDTLFAPYHQRLTAEFESRGDRLTALVALHSFTPVFTGVTRPWHIGLLFDQDDRFARPLLDLLRAEPGLVVGENEPYAAEPEFDYSLYVHGAERGLPHLGIELRQDLITDPAGQAHWAALLARLLPQALAAIAA